MCQAEILSRSLRCSMPRTLRGCGLTDDDLGDMAACFDTIGRENLVNL